jgi:arylsulfatase A-like enzyme
MNRHFFRCAFALLTFLQGISVSAAERPPNIIVIMVDDMGYGGLSCYDNPYYKTPEIDRLAAEGLLLTDYHSNGSVCSPTRAALMTGRYQFRSGCHVVINADPKHPDHVRGLAQKEWSFAEAVKTAGYATAIYGKWHLGYKPEFHPVHQGFDEFAGFISGNIDAQSHYDRMVTFDWWQGQKLKDEPGHHSDLITDHTIDFIERHKDQPFFIYAAHGTPHSPHQARGSKVQRGPRKGEIPEWGKDEPEYSKEPGDENWLIKHFMLPVDEGVGRIRQRIADLGLSENTIIWFISDNGGTKGNMSTSSTTKGAKGSLYEGGHRVPGIVWAPGRVTPGKSSALIVGMDIMPTSMALANVESPESKNLDGIDVGPALFDSKALPERPVIWGRDAKKIALRRGPWKLVGKELYNLEKNPKETTDVAQQHPEIVKSMTKECQDLFKEAIADSPYDK